MYNNEKKSYYEKKTLVTINSSDRIKKNKIITEINKEKVVKNGFKIIDNETILVSHNHNYEITNSTEVIFRNIEGNYNSNLNKYAIGGIPIEYLNYNEETGRPIFNVEFIYNNIDNKIVSNSYKIKIPININKNLLILNTEGGGSNIIVEKINKFVRGYEDSSFYKIILPYRFKNISNVKLVSLEMENAQYSIRDSVSKKYNNKNDYIKDNNLIHWINKENETKVSNSFLINNEKMLSLVDNEINNISSKWKKNKTSEEILYEYLSDEYINKIDVNLENLQYNFTNLLYLLKNRIENPLDDTVLTLDMINKIKNNDSYLLKFNSEGKTYKLFLRDRIETDINTDLIENYFINDLDDKNKLIKFINVFTVYNSTINSYNSDLTKNFENEEEYITFSTNTITDSVNIYYYLRYITENANENKLYFKFLNKDEIKLEYYYIKYLFLYQVELLIKEIIQYNYNNNNKNKTLEKYQNEFMNYLIELSKNIKLPLNEIEKSIIDNGYLIEFSINTIKYRLYLKEKPIETSSIKNYNINDFKNLNTFIDFIKKLTSVNTSYKIENINNTSIFINNEYVIPDTKINLTTNNQEIDIYRNIRYIFDISHNDLKDKIIQVSTSSVIILSYNYNNNIIKENNKIYITISINENINNLYIINVTDSTENNSNIIGSLNIKPINNYLTNFSIYGYLHNISLERQIEYIYNNSLVNYKYINDSFVTLIKKIDKEIKESDLNSFNLLVNSKPNLSNEYYWTLPTELNTNIYINNIEKNRKTDCMVETKYNYTDILNIKYIARNNIDIFNIYPIYSIQLPKGNYVIDEFIEEMENKLNTVSRKIYDFNTKLFIEDTKYNIKTSLKRDINKSIFSLELNENNNIIYIYQYDKIYSYSSADLTEVNQSGPFIVNEGYPFIFIKHKNHSLKTGDIINITGAANIFNISTDEINTKHSIYTHKIYRCHIRFILPLEDNVNAEDINSKYFYEGNKFIKFSGYKSGINKINNINNITKDNIGNKNKNIQLDYDISIFELIIGKGDLTLENINETKTEMGRVLHIMKNNSTNNYILDYSLLSENNFKIGSIFKTATTNTYAMIIPEDWTENYLPKYHNILNTEIEEVKNITEGYSIKINKIPNKTSLVGIGGININILKPTEYSILFNKDDSLHEILGFEKKMTDFSLVQSNTYKTEKNIIDKSYLENSFNDNILNMEKYVMIKTLIPHNYNIGDIIYIDNHSLNYNLIETYNPIRLNIKEYEPFLVWYNNLPIQHQKNIKNNLGTVLFKRYCDIGIIIYYTYPYTKKQIYDLGNLGMSIRQYNSLDYNNYKETPIPNIYNLKPDSYIYINQNQKIINRNILNVKTVYKIGLRDGYYKILGNIPIYNKGYYNNYFNNTNSAIIECNYIKIFEDISLNYINYNQTIYSNTTKYKESVLEGNLNNGEIIAPTLDTKIVGNKESNYNKYSTIYKNKIDSNKINVYFPLEQTTNFYINNVNNIYYVNNNNIVKKINIYENISYIFDISDISLLNKLFVISNNKINIVPYNSKNININGLPGVKNSYIEINVSVYSGIYKLYIIVENIVILELNIVEVKTVEYNIKLKNDNFEFTDQSNNNILINPILNIEFGKKYKLQFINSKDQNELKTDEKWIQDAVIAYNKFMIIYEGILNKNVIVDFITYNNVDLNIILFLKNNNYEKELYYHINNNNIILGKIIFGIYNYYNIDRVILINSNYIDNINKKILNTEKVNVNIDSNIIKHIIYEKENSYYFRIECKKNINIIDINSYIIPEYKIHFLYENVKKNTNILKIKNNIEKIKIKEIKNNKIILNSPNYNLYKNIIISFNNIIPNTQLKKNDSFYIIEIDETYTKITLGDMETKKEIKINDSKDFIDNIEFIINNSYNYKIKNELKNKSIKINYLESYENLTDKTYNSEISKINNNIKYINTVNNIYYNNISNNVTIIENKKIENISWKSPNGSIYIDLTENNVINYIKCNNIDLNYTNNSPYKIYLYYIENNINYLIGSLNDINNNNIILNTYNKKKFILYIESYGFYNSTYSDLYLYNLEIGYINPIQNDITYLEKYIEKISVNNIINKYNIPEQYLDDNLINDSSVLVLNNNKSGIIDIIFAEETSLKYYKIIQNINNNDITINGKKYETIYDGLITNIELYGSNNIDYSNEIEITGGKYPDIDSPISTVTNNIVNNSGSGNTYIINSKTTKIIERTFTNEYKFKYYRLKILSNINFYPYLNPITDSNQFINNETILFDSITDDYIYNFNSNSININKHKFNLNISGIVVGKYEEIDYSNLYIEDINYIKDVEIEKEYIKLILKYNLLNSHKLGENVIISNSITNENIFSVQNLIIHNKWYSRIFYQGYNSIYPYNCISRTLYESTQKYNSGGGILQMYSNSKYIFKNNEPLYIYKIYLSSISGKYIKPFNEIIYNDYNIIKLVEDNDYIFTIKKSKYPDIDSSIMNYKLILSPINNLNDSTEEIISSTGEIVYELTNNNFKEININYNNNKEGLPIIQEYLSNKIHIENMNGFYVPEICYNEIGNEINKRDSKNIITPVIDNNYDTFTYSYLDLVFKSDNKSLNVEENELYKNGIPIFGYYKNDIWTDSYNNDNYYVNYYSITIEGKYIGFGGSINNKTNNTDSLINKNIKGFKILDIGYDNNNIKNIMKLDLKISDLGINNPKIYLGDLELINEETKKHNYIIGYGGNIYQKKIYKNITGINGPKHLYLSIEKLNNILTTNKTNYFSKIILSSNPGTHLYDTFVENETKFEKKPLDELSELEIKFINDEGKLFDLENTEHSFVLEITELVTDYDNSNYLLN